jgi:fucose 4-O-acetylase-like acetyltransferase
VLWGFDQLQRRLSLTWLVVLGRSSLLLYVAHVALIAFLLDEWFQGQTLPAYLALYLAMAVSLWVLAWVTQRGRHWFVKARSRPTEGARTA